MSSFILQTHKKVTSRLFKKFNRFHERWLEKNVEKPQRIACEDWLCGLVDGSVPEEDKDEDVEMKDVSNDDDSKSSTSKVRSSESNQDNVKSTDSTRIRTQRIVTDNPDETPYRPFCKYLAQCT